MDRKTYLLVGCFGVASVLLVIVLVAPLAHLSSWMSARTGALAVYGLGAAWVFLAFVLLERFRRPR